MAELQAYYDEQMAYYSGEMDKVLANNKRLYDEDWTAYANRTAKLEAAEQGLTDFNNAQMGYRLGAQENYITAFNQTALGMETGYNTLNDYQAGMSKAVKDATEEMQESYEIWKENTEATMEAAGTSVHDFAEDMKQDIDENVIPSAEEARDTTVDMARTAEDAMEGLINQAETWRDKYSDAL